MIKDSFTFFISESTLRKKFAHLSKFDRYILKFSSNLLPVSTFQRWANFFGSVLSGIKNVKLFLVCYYVVTNLGLLKTCSSFLTLIESSLFRLA